MGVIITKLKINLNDGRLGRIVQVHNAISRWH